MTHSYPLHYDTTDKVGEIDLSINETVDFQCTELFNDNTGYLQGEVGTTGAQSVAFWFKTPVQTACLFAQNNTANNDFTNLLISNGSTLTYYINDKSVFVKPSISEVINLGSPQPQLAPWSRC